MLQEYSSYLFVAAAACALGVTLGAWALNRWYGRTFLPVLPALEEYKDTYVVESIRVHHGGSGYSFSVDGGENIYVIDFFQDGDVRSCVRLTKSRQPFHSRATGNVNRQAVYRIVSRYTGISVENVTDDTLLGEHDEVIISACMSANVGGDEAFVGNARLFTVGDLIHELQLRR